MSVITVIKKIGETVLSIVEWPIKHSVLLVEMLDEVGKDTPKVEQAVVGLVQQFEALGPDVVEALAEKGLDIPEDLKAVADVKALFTYFNGTFLPAIEAAYADFKKLEQQQIASGSAPAAAAAVAAPGLHNTVAA